MDREVGAVHAVLDVDHHVVTFAHLDGRPRHLSVHNLSGTLDTVGGHALAIAAELTRRAGKAQSASTLTTLRDQHVARLLPLKCLMRFAQMRRQSGRLRRRAI